MLANSDISGTSANLTVTRLTSPQFSTVGFTSATLSYQSMHFNTTSETNVSLEYSLNGSTWTSLATYTNTSSTGNTASNVHAWPVVSVSLPAAALNQSTVSIRFRYDASYDWWWGVDNIKLVATYPANITWSPATDLYTDASEATAYVANTPATTVYAKPTTTTTYTATASANSCTSGAISTITLDQASTNVALATASTNGTILEATCEEGGWTFYKAPGDATNRYLLGILWGSGNVAAKAAAQPTIQLDPTYFAATSGNIGTWAMKRFWNVNIGAATLDAPVSLRFFYDAAEAQEIMDAKAAFLAANPNSTDIGSYWLKTTTGAYRPSAQSVCQLLALCHTSGGIGVESPLKVLCAGLVADLQQKARTNARACRNIHRQKNPFFNYLPWQFLYFFPLPQGQGSFLPIFGSTLTGCCFTAVCSAEGSK